MHRIWVPNAKYLLHNPVSLKGREGNTRERTERFTIAPAGVIVAPLLQSISSSPFQGNCRWYSQETRERVEVLLLSSNQHWAKTIYRDMSSIVNRSVFFASQSWSLFKWKHCFSFPESAVLIFFFFHNFLELTSTCIAKPTLQLRSFFYIFFFTVLLIRRRYYFRDYSGCLRRRTASDPANGTRLAPSRSSVLPLSGVINKILPGSRHVVAALSSESKNCWLAVNS